MIDSHIETGRHQRIENIGSLGFSFLRVPLQKGEALESREGCVFRESLSGSPADSTGVQLTVTFLSGSFPSLLGFAGPELEYAVYEGQHY